jgi:hypothetical protein
MPASVSPLSPPLNRPSPVQAPSLAPPSRRPSKRLSLPLLATSRLTTRRKGFFRHSSPINRRTRDCLFLISTRRRRKLRASSLSDLLRLLSFRCRPPLTLSPERSLRRHLRRPHMKADRLRPTLANPLRLRTKACQHPRLHPPPSPRSARMLPLFRPFPRPLNAGLPLPPLPP